MARLEARNVSKEAKAAITAAAGRRGASAGELMDRLAGGLGALAPSVLDNALDQLLALSPSTARPARPVSEAGGARNIHIRLWGQERSTVERLAAAEGRTAPAWVAAVVRQAALRAVPFQAQELKALQQTITALGQLGRNINVLVRQWHRSGKLDREAMEIERVGKLVENLRREVRGMADRAVRRYTPADPGDAEV